MTNDQKAFELWLEGRPWQGQGKTRREFSDQTGVKLSDLAWAFCSGYNKGFLIGLEEGSSTNER